jgi:hypothetical protein
MTKENVKGEEYIRFSSFRKFGYLFEELVVVKNTYANKLDDVDDRVCVCRVIIETRKESARKRERRRRIERKECERTTTRRGEEKKEKECLIFSLTANQLHGTHT